MNDYKIKASDFTVESLKLIVTIATLLFAALLAYGTNISTPIMKFSYYIGLSFLGLSSILSVANINSLINKIFRGDEDAIMHTEAKVINVLAVFFLLAGILAGALYISYNSTSQKQIQPICDPKCSYISDDKVIIGTEVKSKMSILRNNSGKISEIKIEP